VAIRAGGMIFGMCAHAAGATLRRSATALLVVVEFLASCTSSHEEPAAGRLSNESAPAPGDTWFHRLDQVRVVDYPASNLPPSLRSSVEAPFRMRTEPIAPYAWANASDPPGDASATIEGGVKLRWLESDPGIALAPGAPPPQVVNAGDLLFRWDAAAGRLLVLADQPPARIALDYLADPKGTLGDFELSLRRSARAAPPQAAELVRRMRFGAVTRDALLLPAGGRLALEVAELDVDALRVAFAVRDFAIDAVDGAVERARRRGDGAVGAVDVVVRGERSRLWSSAVDRDGLDAPWVEASVDLAPFRGERVRFELVTEPGARGDAAFDYACFGELRFEGTPRRAPARPDLVVIDVDTLRADALTLYGSARPTTPRLAAWAREQAMVYRDARTASSWTLPSTVSILSGTWVEQHGVINRVAARRHAVPMVASLLRAAGYETIGHADGGFVTAAFGFDDGFDRFESSYCEEGDAAASWSSTLKLVRSRRSERPLFLFLHTYCVHSPYRCDLRFEADEAPYRGPFAGRDVDESSLDSAARAGVELTDEDFGYLRRLYDAGVARLDGALIGAIEALESALAGRDVLLVVTSDHGEAFGEHGRVGHRSALHEELLRVPLVVKYPPSLGRRLVGESDLPVSSVDVASTLLALAGVERPPYMPGRVLFEAQADRAPRFARHGRRERCVELDGWKLIDRRVDGRIVRELFHVAADPLERIDRSKQEPARLAALARCLDATSELPPIPDSGRRRAELEDDAIRDLRALGYGE